ncbi:ImmA/IrrE family metallo-endopeptidase [Corynebacterium suicordis]|uniref:ImmA/IrrE family metallo-endopeptidase n=1 Tax=Corynebacterium suicordis DSM 45110 TaxID=1121369 RepID=A0ABR9ZLY0_9CORY|nr:ImmA/IrrE family metallo-endopeptidase [Corynebacterium suicordis]MBF4554404.1 ImmA/IrrE family metallo-endopeptidase [Corynebacterium suicordis DSM 45110]MDR6278641.1 Zn-dependent peptidase ImmA (M78 family) [Corynebacterium suicordis]
MVVRVDVAPELLRWAVRRSGWDEEIASRRAPKLSAWLDEKERPTLKQLKKFANDTHTPFGLLFLPEPPEETVPIPDMRTMGNLGVHQPSADLLDTIYLCLRRQEWYREYALLNGFDEISFVGSTTVDTPVISVANQIRNVLGFGLSERKVFPDWEQALRRLIDYIEDTGVLVMVNGIVGSNTHRKLDPSEFRGFALADPLVPLIFVNGADTKAAQIFTLIHELAHIWLGGSALSDAAMTATGEPEEERWCNQVAAEVLVPLTLLVEEFNGVIDVDELERLAKRFRVSTLVVLKRLYDAKALDWDSYLQEYEKEKQRVLAILTSRRGDKGGGNYYYTQPLRLSRSFSRAVISSTFEGSTSYREAYQLLGTKKHRTFENLAEQLGVA